MTAHDAPAVSRDVGIRKMRIDAVGVMLPLVEIREIDLRLHFAAEDLAVFRPNPCPHSLDRRRERRVATSRDRPEKGLLIAKPFVARIPKVGKKKAGLALGPDREDRVRKIENRIIHEIEGCSPDNRVTLALQIDRLSLHLPARWTRFTEAGREKPLINVINLTGKLLKVPTSNAELVVLQEDFPVFDLSGFLFQVKAHGIAFEPSLTLIDNHLPFGFSIFRGLVDRYLISLKDQLLAMNLYISLSLQDLRASVHTKRIGIDNDRAFLFPRRLLHVLGKASRLARQRDQDRPQDGHSAT